MGWNGSGNIVRNTGVYTGTQVWQNTRDASRAIRADDHDAHDEDLADAIENTIAKDGQNTPTANLPMGGFKHTGVASSAARNQYATVAQIQDGDYLELGTVSGTDTITAAASPTITAYAQGQTFRFKAAGTNTGATTININSVGAKAIQKLGAALVAGDITANDVVVVYYDGTQFQMLTPARTPVLANGTGADASIVTGTAGSDGELGAWNTDGDMVGSGYSVIDEDDLSSDSDTAVPTQQSIKAYVDDSIAAIPSDFTINTTETLSGTTHTSSGIPSGTKRVTLTINQASLDGTDALVIQLGDSGGIEATGYVSICSFIAGTAIGATATSTAAFIVTTSAAAAATWSGSIILTKASTTGHTWIVTGSMQREDSPGLVPVSGRKTLSGELTQLRILGASATASFDGGTITRLDEQ